MEWQPIETAPKGGPDILMCGHDYGDPKNTRHVVCVSYGINGWYICEEDNPYTYGTHWMPTPELPK